MRTASGNTSPFRYLTETIGELEVRASSIRCCHLNRPGLSAEALHLVAAYFDRDSAYYGPSAGFVPSRINVANEQAYAGHLAEIRGRLQRYL